MVKATTEDHEVAYQDLVRLLREKSDNLTSAEMLAVASNMVGKLVALQDHRVMTAAQAMQIVSNNIELGNKQAIAEMCAGTPMGRA